MIHAEANAIYNAVRQGKSTQGMRVYVTGKPCVACYQMMHQCGIDEIVYTNVSMPKMVENCESFVTIRDVLDLGGPELVFIDKSNLDISFLEILKETFFVRYFFFLLFSTESTYQPEANLVSISS